VDGEYGAAVIIFAGELELELEVLKLRLDAVELFADAFGGRGFVFGDGKFEQPGGIACAPFDAPPDFDLGTKVRKFLQQVAGGIRVIPERGLGGLRFEFGYALFIVSDVKGAPGCQRCGPAGRSPGSRVRACFEYSKHSASSQGPRTRGDRVDSAQSTIRGAAHGDDSIRDRAHRYGRHGLHAHA